MDKKQEKTSRNFIGIHFKCCNVYLRIYKNKAGTAYAGCCPKCFKRAIIKIGQNGTDSRFFEAS